MNLVHIKKDGYLLVRPDGEIRFLGLVESILFIIFGKVPTK
jgi:hypothetical protein